ncbi:MAG: nitroreductase family protein [Candidatus Thermoplasmatota archaeon]|jgi:nitroreductase|nr:nitroreductase family protein [Candidatus Thermoplasmatota archaeon]MCL5963717.1 nitroreductase family protein [Candidatus Thermoplasmatota archaeon]
MNLLELVKNRKSIRNYKETDISDEMLNLIFQVVRMAPSSSNLQPWKFIAVRDIERKKKIANACQNQKFLIQAPVIVVACGVVDDARDLVGGYMVSYPVDVAIAMTYLILAAEEKGLGTCWIGDFNEEKLSNILQIPSSIKVVAVASLGYPNENPSQEYRKNVNEILSFETLQ